MVGGDEVAEVDAIKHELNGRLMDVDVGKTHISVRYESGPRIVRVGACIGTYNWDNREKVLDRLVDFMHDHAEDYSVEFDIVPLDAVVDPEYAEA